jgi:hypothetical protein
VRRVLVALATAAAVAVFAVGTALADDPWDDPAGTAGLADVSAPAVAGAVAQPSCVCGDDGWCDCDDD